MKCACECATESEAATPQPQPPVTEAYINTVESRSGMSLTHAQALARASINSDLDSSLDFQRMNAATHVEILCSNTSLQYVI